MLLSIILPIVVFSQNGNDLRNGTSTKQIQPSPLGNEKLLKLIGGTGIISGITSAILTGLINIYMLKGQLKNKFKELDTQLKHNIDQIEYERKVNIMQDRLNIYASIFFYLNKLQKLLHYECAEEQTEEIKHKINSLYESKLYLLSSDMLTGLIKLDQDDNKAAKDDLIDLIEILISEYNNKILKEYQDITKVELPRLQKN